MSNTPRTDALVDENAKLAGKNLELRKALKGTLFLFEAHAASKTDLEQIAFARRALYGE